MSYFNHAFHKGFLVNKVSNGPEDAGEVQIQDLTAGQLSFYNKNYVHSDVNASIAPESGPGIWAVGSLHLEPGKTITNTSKDSIGNNPGHGGYTESSKTKGINGNYITRLTHTAPDTGALPSARITVGNTCAPCGENLFLRMDIKGSSALRFLNHNAYAIGDSSGDAALGDLPSLCCDPGTGVPGSEQEYLDPAVALAAAADMLLRDPLIKPFINASTAKIIIMKGGVETSLLVAQVLDAAVYTPELKPELLDMTATLVVEGGYVDTKFGNCSFDTRDHYEKEPISIVMSILDETGDPCNDCGIFEAAPGRMSTTSGESVLRDLILSERYMQNPLSQGAKNSSRIREIEQSSDIINAVDRDALYHVFTLEHVVPRFNNPSGIFDNDKYCYSFYVKGGDTPEEEKLVSDMNSIWNSLAKNVKVTVEKYDCGGQSEEEENGGKG